MTMQHVYIITFTTLMILGILAFVKHSKFLYVALYIIGFAVSGFSTLRLLMDSFTDPETKLIGAGMTIVFEFGKGLMFIASFNAYKKTFRTIWLFLAVLSVVASMTLMINESEQLNNKGIMGSREYQVTSEKIDSLKEQINSKTKTIQQTTEQNNSVLASGEKSLTDKYSEGMKKVNDLPKDNLTQRLKETNKLNTQRSTDQKNLEKSVGTGQATINKMNTELDGLNNQYTQAIKDLDSLKKTNKNSQGYNAVVRIIAQKFKWDFQTVNLFFMLIFTSIFEFLICFIYWISKNPHILRAEPTQGFKEPKKPFKIGFKGNEKPALGLRGSDLSPTLPDIPRDDIKNYIEWGWDNSAGTQLPWYKKISKNIGISGSEGRKIQAHLEKIGLTKCDGSRTEIQVSKNDALKMV